MRVFVLCMVAIAVAAPAFALLPAPYIGANLQVNSPTGKWKETDIVDEEGGAKTGLGGEIDLGITAGPGSLYAGYRFGQHSVKARYEAGDQSGTYEGDWRLNRFVLGARWHLLGSLPLSPTLGGGLTIGKTELDADAVIGGTPRSVAQSSNKTGWFAEVGAILRIPALPLSAVADIQYHRFAAEFDTDAFNGTFDIAFFTFQAGLQYAFLPMVP